MTSALVAAGCGFSAARSGAGHDDASVDGSDADAIDAAPGTVCYGASGVWRVCLAAAPTGDVALPMMLDTDRDPICLQAQPSGWTPAQPPACFVVGDTVSVTSTTVTGGRPLVLVGHSRITIDVLLDVASHHKGKSPAASPSSECKSFAQDPTDRGGGAGGSFQSRGGNGGRGDGGQGPNGQSGVADGVPTKLRGGCAGQVGNGSAPKDPGDPGGGGGAVYLVAGGTIAVNGVINASGAGGSGGDMRSGGSGGGSGGVIVLHGTLITTLVNGVLVANGGGGAGGASMSSRGVDGADPSTTMPLLAVPGGNGSAGDGGAGFPATGNALDGNSGPSNEGGGGGGGGAGYIRANQLLVIGLVVSPPADIVLSL
jgi:hypothetical protein